MLLFHLPLHIMSNRPLGTELVFFCFDIDDGHLVPKSIKLKIPKSEIEQESLKQVSAISTRQFQVEVPAFSWPSIVTCTNQAVPVSIPLCSVPSSHQALHSNLSPFPTPNFHERNQRFHFFPFLPAQAPHLTVKVGKRVSLTPTSLNVFIYLP